MSYQKSSKKELEGKEIDSDAKKRFILLKFQIPHENFDSDYRHHSSRAYIQ